MNQFKPAILIGTLALFTGLLFGCGESTTADKPSAPQGAVASTLVLPTLPPSARLPEGVSPSHYKLHINIDPRETSFTGSADIDIVLAGSTRFFWMHGGELQVSSAIAILPDGKTVELEWEKASETGVAKVSAHEELPAGELRLHVEYSAPFNANLDGLHTVVQGGVSYAYTQFEATAARLAFPSFDEPGFKVPFDISLTT